MQKRICKNCTHYATKYRAQINVTQMTGRNETQQVVIGGYRCRVGKKQERHNDGTITRINEDAWINGSVYASDKEEEAREVPWAAKCLDFEESNPMTILAERFRLAEIPE